MWSQIDITGVIKVDTAQYEERQFAEIASSCTHTMPEMLLVLETPLKPQNSSLLLRFQFQELFQSKGAHTCATMFLAVVWINSNIMIQNVL